MLFLKADSKGILWGGPHFGQTLFSLDPKTKKNVNTGVICDAGGEAYDATFRYGKVYAAAYAGGDIIRYDPRQKWDQLNHKNPKTIASVGPRGYIRPTGGILLGADGKLYSGWMARYGEYGGAVAITDPTTGYTELIENPLGEQAVSSVLVDGNLAYAGTSLSANGLPQKQGESAKFGMIDLSTREIVFERPLGGALDVRVLAYDAGSKRVALAVNAAVWLFDTETRQFQEGADIPPVRCGTVGLRGGKLYYGSGQAVVELDIRSGKAASIVDAPAKITNVTIGPDGTVYFSCGVDVYAVKR
jgi:hypothetical protein